MFKIDLKINILWLGVDVRTALGDAAKELPGEDGKGDQKDEDCERK